MQRAPDRLLVERARAEDRIVLTFDLDFGEILASGVIAHPSVVIFLLSDERADSVNRRLEHVLSEQAKALGNAIRVSAPIFGTAGPPTRSLSKSTFL